MQVCFSTGLYHECLLLVKNMKCLVVEKHVGQTCVRGACHLAVATDNWLEQVREIIYEKRALIDRRVD